MRPLTLSLALLLSLPAALAQSDLGVSIKTTPALAEVGQFLMYEVTVANAGPELARDIRATLEFPLLIDAFADARCDIESARDLRCGVDFLAAGATTTFSVTGRFGFPQDQQTVEATAAVRAATADPNPANDTASHVVKVLDPRLLTVSINAPEERRADGTATWYVAVQNHTRHVASGRKLQLTMNSGETFVAAPAGCVIQRNVVTCDLPPIAPSTSLEPPLPLAFTVQHPRAGHSYAFANVLFGGTGSAEAVFARKYIVTSPADAGPGSLREIIGVVNTECASDEPCNIEFAIDDAIRPLTPLPVIRARDIGLVRGVQLDGSALTSGHGLAFMNAVYVRVKNLHIHSFPWNGIDVREFSSVVTITGNRIEGNGGRGLEVNRVVGLVDSNQFLRNGRSGAFFGTGGSVAFRNNVAEGNGASGVYFGPNIDQTVVEGNHILDNVHAGVALASFARITVRGNSIRHNNNGGIDIGLNGPSVGGTPVITSAKYENGVTLIEGHAESAEFVYLYANSSLESGDLAEGETFLGRTSGGHFKFRFDGDLRGQYINGVATLYSSRHIEDNGRTTSEFGRATAVE